MATTNSKWVGSSKSFIGAVIAAGPIFLNWIGIGTDPDDWIRLGEALNTFMQAGLVVFGLSVTIWGRIQAARDPTKITVLPAALTPKSEPEPLIQKRPPDVLK